MKTIKFQIKVDEIIDGEEAKSAIIHYLKSELDYKDRNKLQTITREIVSDLVEQIATKDFKKEIKNIVKQTIQTHERSDLTFRDGYRDMLLASAKKFESLIDEKVKATIDAEQAGALYSAIGNNIAGKFYEYVKKDY